MDNVTGNPTDERLAQLRQLLDTMQPPAASEPEASRPLTAGEADDLARQLGEYLRQLQQDTTARLDRIEKTGLSNNAWLAQIGEKVKTFDINLLAIAGLIFIAPLLLKSCGG